MIKLNEDRREEIENELAGSYEKWLINSLKDKENLIAYIQGALEEYKNDNNLEALLLALEHVRKAKLNQNEQIK